MLNAKRIGPGRGDKPQDKSFWSIETGIRVLKKSNSYVEFLNRTLKRGSYD